MIVIIYEISREKLTGLIKQLIFFITFYIFYESGTKTFLNVSLTNTQWHTLAFPYQ